TSVRVVTAPSGSTCHRTSTLEMGERDVVWQVTFTGSELLGITGEFSTPHTIGPGADCVGSRKLPGDHQELRPGEGHLPDHVPLPHLQGRGPVARRAAGRGDHPHTG